LTQLGFVFKENSKARYLTETVKALEIFCSIYGDCVVPTGFKVPSDEQWPKNLHGISLGSRVRAIRQRKLVLDTKSKNSIEKIGFVFNPRKKEFEELLYSVKFYVNTTLSEGGTIPVEIPESYVKY
jgi:hypothetical protein